MVGPRPRFLFPLILIFMGVPVWCQDELGRALARKIAAGLKPREPVTLSFHNLSTLAPEEMAAAQSELGRALTGLGVVVTERSPGALDVAITFSETLDKILWVAEIQHPDRREIVMEEKPRTTVPINMSSVRIDRQLLFEQDQRILDLAVMGRALLVLDAEAVSLYDNQGGAWQRKLSVRIPVVGPWPRDFRGRLAVQGDAYHAYLPGFTCNGNAGGGMSITCSHAEPWPIGAEASSAFTPGRNFFENRLILSNGIQKTVPPFFTAVSAGKERIFAGTDGRISLYSDALEPLGHWTGWGSDMAAIESECMRTLLLVTGTGDETAPDSVAAYELSGGTPRRVGDPLSFTGPVIALRTSSEPGAAFAVSREFKTGRYAAFRLAIPCSR